MNYRHIYHAGSFADAFKHILLMSLVDAFVTKEKPFFYLDTHSGIACYDLEKIEAQKSQEYISGVLKIIHAQKIVSPLIQKYRTIIEDFNKTKKSKRFRFYPGSPYFVQYLKRAQDRSALIELHPEDFLQLRHEFLHTKSTAVHHADGYAALKSLLPPKENRGFILIDPPFEKTTEFKQIIEGVKVANQRWPGGCIAIWYPIKNRTTVNNFYHELKNTGIREILICEITRGPLPENPLNGCGMLVIRPPWQWKETIEQMLPEFCQLVEIKKGYQIKWLVPE